MSKQRIENISNEIAIEYVSTVGNGILPSTIRSVVNTKRGEIVRTVNDSRRNKSDLLDLVRVKAEYKAQVMLNERGLTGKLESLKAEADRAEQAAAAAQSAKENAPLGKLLAEISTAC